MSRSLFVLICESNFGHLGLLKPRFNIESTGRPKFSQKSILMDCWVDLYCFSEALGAVFLIFAALGTSLDIDGFSGAFGSRIHGVGVVNHVEFWACEEIK